MILYVHNHQAQTKHITSAQCSLQCHFLKLSFLYVVLHWVVFYSRAVQDRLYESDFDKQIKALKNIEQKPNKNE